MDRLAERESDFSEFGKNVEFILYDGPESSSGPLTPYTISLREERDKFHLVIENITDGVVVTDAEHRIIHHNTPAEKIIGVEREKLLGSPLWLHCAEIWKSALIQKKMYYREEEIRCAAGKDGEEKVLKIYLAPLVVNDARELNLALTIRDVTRERRIDEMKTQFVSNVSHELRTPLACIKGFVSTLRRRKNLTDTQKEEFLGIVDKESDRLTRLIEDLLCLSRIEADSFRLETSSFGLVDLVREIYAEFEHQFVPRNIRFRLFAPNEMPETVADRDKIHQLVMNLVSNAAKFSPDGGEIVCEVYHDAARGGFVVSVRDSGRGIRKENLPRLFTKFFREEDSVHTFPGTGLGLSIVKTIAEKHGGSVSVESEEGRGAKFTAWIPQGRMDPTAAGSDREKGQ